jgi:hypothetical protein
VKGYEHLRSIDGMGNITITIILNAIGDIGDFDKKRS